MAKNYYKDKKIQKKAIEVARDFYNNWEKNVGGSNQYSLLSKWESINKMAWVFKMMNVEEKNNKTLFNICFELIQSGISNLYNNSPYFKLFAKGDEDEKKVEQAKNYLEAQWREQDTDLVMEDSISNCLTFGTHQIMLGTDLVKKSKTKKTEDGKYELETYTARDTAGIKHIPLWDWLIDSKEKDIQNAPGVGYKEENVLVSDLDARGFYFNLDKLFTNEEGGDNNVGPSDTRSEDKDGTQKVRNTKLPIVPLVINFYGLMILEEGKPPVEVIISIAGTRDKYELIRFEENFYRDENGNPYRPFIDLHDMRRKDQYYSVGEVETVMGLEAVFNTFIRQRIDSVKKAIKNKVFAQENSIINEEDYYNTSDNQIVYTKAGAQPPTPVPYDDVTSGVFNDLGFIRDEINKISGKQDIGKVTSSTPATNALIAQEAENKRYGTKRKNLDRFVKKYIKMRLNLNNQFLTKKQKIRMNNGSVDIEAKPINNVDVVIEAGSMQAPNSAQEQQKAQMLLQIAMEFGQVEVMQLPPLVRFALINQLKALGFSDVNDILGIEDEEAVEQDQENAMAQQAKMQEAQLIDAENEGILKGENPPVTANQDQKEHMDKHTDFKNMKEMRGVWGEKANKAYTDHLLDHQIYYEQQNPQPNYRRQYQEAQAREGNSSERVSKGADEQQMFPTGARQGEGIKSEATGQIQGRTRF